MKTKTSSNVPDKVPKVEGLKDQSGNLRQIQITYPDGSKRTIKDDEFTRYVNTGDIPIPLDGEDSSASGIVCVSDSGNGCVTWTEYRPESCLEHGYTITESEGDPVESVDHPKHYTSHPSGVECIDIIRHYGFDIGCAMKYLWRHGLKTEDGMTDDEKSCEDLKKAIWYIVDEIRAKYPDSGISEFLEKLASES